MGLTIRIDRAAPRQRILGWPVMRMRFLILLLLLLAVPSWASEPVPIPELATWKADLLTFGERQCHYFREPGWEGGQGDTFYDGARVFYQAADYLGDSNFNGTPWVRCAELAAVKYATTQVTPNGAAPWNVFSTGLRLHFQRTEDSLSKQTVHIVATTGFAADSTRTGGLFNPDYGSTYDLAREIAYAIKAHLDDEALGAPHRARLDELVNHAIKHYDQWFVSKRAQTNPIPGVGIQPFMVGLSMQALIAYYEKYPDPRIPPLIRLATDELYRLAWRPRDGGFYYNGPGSGIEPGLNLLIAPAYAWMYMTTGETIYRDRGDEIFKAGVHKTHCASLVDAQCPEGLTQGGWLWSGKQFNQQYMWSFDYIKWRQRAERAAPVPTPVPPPTPAPEPVPTPTPEPIPEPIPPPATKPKVTITITAPPEVDVQVERK